MWNHTSFINFPEDTVFLLKKSTCATHSLYSRTKEPLDESERGEGKTCLKLNIQKTKIMASGPITPWQTEGKTMETDFILGGSKSLQIVTAAMKLKGVCSWEEKA